MNALSIRQKYLALSLGTGIIEIGLPLLIARAHGSILAVLASGLAYQVGAPLARRVRHRAAIGAIGGIGIAALVIAAAAGTPAWFVLAAGPLALVLQYGRHQTASVRGVSTAVKRSTRIAGFLLAAVVTGPAIVVVASGLVVLAVAARPPGAGGHTPTDRTWTLPRTLMVIHQAHYFVYAYSLVWVLAHQPAAEGWTIGALFSLGWVSYTLTPSLLRNVDPRRAVVAGHAWTAVMLLGLCVIDDLVMITFLWIGTGLGGGTVFGLRQFCEAAGDDEATIDHWEELGHVAGAALAVLIGTTTWNFAAAAALAAAVAISASSVRYVVPSSHDLPLGSHS
jgi:hypothetical protein